ncbi:MAG TPA: hypothetical protein VFY56_00760 [Propionibacteriaceae bacterium]|nr:hypothetical protein [Propionibacteriaceae bacterium]
MGVPVRADGTFEDGSIIGYIVGTDEHSSGAVYDFNLTDVAQPTHTTYNRAPSVGPPPHHVGSPCGQREPAMFIEVGHVSEPAEIAVLVMSRVVQIIG